MSRSWFALFLAGLMGLAACQPQEIVLEVTRVVDTEPIVQTELMEVTRVVPETIVEEATRLVTEDVVVEVDVTRPPTGSSARPVQLLFSPVAEQQVIETRGPVLADYLTQASGQAFTVSVLEDEAAVIERLCAAPAETMAFVSAEAYVLAQEQCQAEIGSTLVNSDGITWQTGMIVSRRDSGINSLADLQGKRWAVADADDIPTFLYFQALLQDEGIEPGEIVDVSGESAAMLAVFEGQADFASAEYIPPVMPFEERLWEYGEDDPEPDRYLGIPPRRSPIGYVVVNGEPEFGGYRLRDARARVFDVAPEIYDETQIVTLSAQIPNDTVAFGRDFPLGLARQMIVTLRAFAESDVCDESLCATDFYNLTGLLPAQEEAFAPVEFVQDTLELSSDDMLDLASR